jgi:hypothetical protein
MLRKLTITFSPEEREALDRLAQQDLRPAKDQLRLLVREEAQRRGVWPPKQPERKTQPAAL